MSILTIFGACAVTIMLLSYALEKRSAWWVLIFALACTASSLYSWLAGTWPYGSQPCHAERNEASRLPARQTLRFAQGDKRTLSC
jgi:hypothetical protein